MRYEDHMPKNYTPLYALYVGSREGLPFSEEDLDALFKSVAEMFLSFTVLTAEGFYLGKRLPTRVIQVATSDVQRVEELCQIIGKRLDQKWVGLNVGGAYSSIKIN